MYVAVRTVLVFSHSCVKCLISFEVYLLKHRVKKWRSIFRHAECVIFFWLLELPRQTAWHLKKHTSEKFSLFYLLTLSRAWQCIDLGGKAAAQSCRRSLWQPRQLLRQCYFDFATLSAIFSLLSWPGAPGKLLMDIFFQIFIQSHNSFSAHLLGSLLWEKICRHRVRSDTLYGAVDVCADHTFQSILLQWRLWALPLGKQFQEVLLHL